MSHKDQYSNPDEMLNDILQRNNIPRSLFDKLLKEEKSRVHLQRRRGIVEQLRHIVEQHESKGDKK